MTAAVGGAPLSGICVDAFSSTGGSGLATTGADGTYSVTGLAAASYTVEFSAGCGNGGNFATEYYNNQPSPATANSVPVTAGATTSAINAAMRAGGTIAGTVTAAIGGAPLAGIGVDAFPSTGGVVSGPGSGRATAADGTYSFTGLATASYAVEFSKGCGNGGDVATQYYNNEPSLATANLVTVAAAYRRDDQRHRQPVRGRGPDGDHHLHPVRPRQRHLYRDAGVDLDQDGERHGRHLRPFHDGRGRYLPVRGVLQRRRQKRGDRGWVQRFE